ncbi:NAD-dependent epimerase/dehydratase family protein [Nocardiopsis composta]|uniref:UDP-glucose 4-epimerase n=1 Tax=Nocardiopsis composta TaxID=157465 RepID=A0A7W8VF09_9ACTN|nr:NAD-dependent epimerase/dehydratase family protein [Nocardiopsis composta]MBB5434081.1 UDP-glucose 4-epimerase [Nocardiopsis composta]
MGRVVLVTGVSRYLGARVAEQLSEDPGVDRVVAIDSAAVPRPLGAAEFTRVRLYDDSISAALRDSDADTVVHLGFAEAPRGRGKRRRTPSGGNALGTMQLLSACQRSEAAQRLVVRSSAAVYGSPDPGAPCTEEIGSREVPRSAYAQDAAEVERYTRALSRRRPDLSVAVLRFASFIGPAVETPLTRYFGLRVVPTVRGYDPRMQFIHPDDGVEAVRRMALGGDGEGALDGVFNVAAPGSLPLSHCLRRVGGRRFAVPERGLRMLRGIARRTELDYSPEQLRLLCCDRVLDYGKLERTLGWSPSYTSQEAFESYLAAAAA